MNILNAIIDNLFLVERLGDYVPTIIQIAVALIWIVLTRKSTRRYQMSLIVSLFLLFVSILALVLTLTTVAKIIGIYVFLFLGIGMLQAVFSD